MTDEVSFEEVDDGDAKGSLVMIQRDLKVGKTHYNSFGEYRFRSKSDILEAVKPLAAALGCYVVCDDEFVELGGDVYCKTTASLVHAGTGTCVEMSGWAKEPPVPRKKMDESQTSGCASSYAGKYALCNLFAIDDGVDADALEPERTSVDFPHVFHCRSCGARYTFESQEQVDGMKCCPHPDYEAE